jgi:hypothetical protein
MKHPLATLLRKARLSEMVAENPYVRNENVGPRHRAILPKFCKPWESVDPINETLKLIMPHLSHIGYQCAPLRLYVSVDAFRRAEEESMSINLTQEDSMHTAQGPG